MPTAAARFMGPESEPTNRSELCRRAAASMIVRSQAFTVGAPAACKRRSARAAWSGPPIRKTVPGVRWRSPAMNSPPFLGPVLVGSRAADAEHDPGPWLHGIALHHGRGQGRPQAQDRLAGRERDLHGLHQCGQPFDRMVVIEFAIDARIGDEPALGPEAEADSFWHPGREGRKRRPGTAVQGSTPSRAAAGATAR